MKHAIVEKRIAGIIRWLERLNKSYSTGEMESALMEAECAKADLETLRRDVWAKVQPEAIRSHRLTLMAMLRPAFLAMLIVVLAVAPIARDIPAPAEPVAAVQAAEVVTQPQQLEVKPEAPVVAAKTETPKRQQQVSRKAAVVSKKPVVAETPASTPTSTPTEGKTSKAVAYDKVFSLMQTGQRALKNNTSVIKVQ